jgi:hypothetical protein
VHIDTLSYTLFCGRFIVNKATLCPANLSKRTNAKSKDAGISYKLPALHSKSLGHRMAL